MHRTPEMESLQRSTDRTIEALATMTQREQENLLARCERILGDNLGRSLPLHFQHILQSSSPAYVERELERFNFEVFWKLETLRLKREAEKHLRRSKSRGLLHLLRRGNDRESA